MFRKFGLRLDSLTTILIYSRTEGLTMDPLKQLQKKMEKVRSDDRLTVNNRLFLERFKDRCLADSMSPMRIAKYLYYLSLQGAVLGKDFDTATKEDLQRVVADIESRNWAEWTKYDNKTMLKAFYKWLEGDGETYPKKVSWLRARIKNNKLMESHDLLTDEEVRTMLEACTHIRDKAFVSVLYESGCRISELLNMKVKDAVQDDYGFVIHVSGKTGPRRIRLIDSIPYLSNWVANHPKDRESPLWVSIGSKNNGERLCYNTVRDLLHKLAEKAGIRKPINPHAWRKSNSTKLVAQGMTEFELKRRQGWVASSRVAEVYVRLSGKNDDDAYFRTKGICLSCKKNKAVRNNLCEECMASPDGNGRQSAIEPRPCPRCAHRCEATAKICSQCGFPLSEKVAEELLEKRRKADAIMNVATEHPELMAVLEKIIRERKL